MGQPYYEKHLTSLAGEFAVASQLCLQKYNASLTLKNFPKVDIFVNNPINGKQASVQVKTSRSGHFDPSENLSENSILVYVHIKHDEQMDFYVIPSKIALAQRRKSLDDDIVKHPNQSKKNTKWLDAAGLFGEYKGKWKNLGLD